MARIQTKINGITTQSTYTEGDCYSLVNLRPKNGALHPVPPRKITNELSQKYDIVFFHQNDNYKNLIGIRHIDGGSVVYGNIDTTPALITQLSKITSVQQIGNTLSLITGEGINYLLYDELNYKVLGKMPEIKKIGYWIDATQTHDITFDKEYGKKPEDVKEGVIGLFNIAAERVNSNENIGATEGMVADFYEAAKNLKLTKDHYRPKFSEIAQAALSSAFDSVDAAIEKINAGINAGKEISDEGLRLVVEYFNNARLKIASYTGNQNSTNTVDSIVQILNQIVEEVNNNPNFFIKSAKAPSLYLIDAHLLVFAFRLYDGSTVKQTSPILLCPTRRENVSETKLINSNALRVMVYGVTLDVDTSYLTEWKDIIKSVDVFLSPGLGYNSTSNIYIPPVVTNNLWLLKNQSAMIKNIEETGNFYLIDSISTGEGEVLYASQSTPTSYEIPISNIVCPTPFGVAFVSSRGICIIAGQQVELLTSQLQQSPQLLNTNVFGFGLDSSPVNFTEFLKTIEHILYNPSENELIMHDRDSGFGFVYCFDGRQFYQTTERFDGVVQNAFPELLVIEDKKIKDWSQSQPSNLHVSLADAHVSFVTRPLLFGTPDIKRLERMILRATLFNMQNQGVNKQSVCIVFYSGDGVTFNMLRGIEFFQSDFRKDIDMGLFAKSKFRQFVIAFAGVVDEKSEIRFLETEIEKEYQSTKMR
ncbi:MAG: hypothetical protein LBF08_08520 [Dysgonamonadaceae bacterium]|jgi:hypothetical protein|nr:hypothetical protein [Dysgonamonadaceae bacterium]